MKRTAYLYVKAFSDFGSMMDTIVLSSLILALTGSAFWLSALLLMGVAGGTISALFSGVIADRYDRRKLMIWSDILRALCLLLIIIWPSPIVILGVRFLGGVFNSFFQVGFQSEIPQIFGEDRMLQINSRIARYRSISMVLGFLAGGTLATLLGYQWVLVLDALSFVLSAIALLQMNWESRAHTQSATGTTWTQNFADAGVYLRTKPLVLMIFGIYLIDTFGSASHNLGFPLLAEMLNPANQSFFYGCIWAVWGMGNVLMTSIMPRILNLQEHLFPFFFGCTLLMSTGFIATLSSTSLVPVLVFAFLTGIFDGGAVTAFGMIVQQTENHIRGRVIGVSTFLGQLGFGLGFVVAPLLVHQWGLAPMVWVLHGVVITCTLLVVLRYRSLQRT